MPSECINSQYSKGLINWYHSDQDLETAEPTGKINKNSQKTQHRNKKNEIDGKKTPEISKFYHRKKKKKLSRLQQSQP